MKYRNIPWFVIALLTACANTGAGVDTGAVKPPSADNSVTFQVQNPSYDKVWLVTDEVTSRLLTITDSDKQTGTLKASRGVVMGPWGDVIRLSIRHTGADDYAIRIQSLKHPDANLARLDWINTLIHRIKVRLRQ